MILQENILMDIFVGVNLRVDVDLGLDYVNLGEVDVVLGVVYVVLSVNLDVGIWLGLVLYVGVWLELEVPSVGLNVSVGLGGDLDVSLVGVVLDV